MALRGVLRVGEVRIRVTDMAAARRHYGQRMGLHEVMEDAEGLVYFKPWDEHDHHSLVLGRDERPGIHYFAWKVFDDASLTRVESKIQEFGFSVDYIAAVKFAKSGRR